MRIPDEHINDTTITPPFEQRTSGGKSSPAHQGQPSLPAQIGHFLLHFVQMCLACCIRGFTLCLLFFEGAALIGYPDLIHQFPELSTLLIAFFVALPMGAWMRLRGMEWRPTLEMAATPIVSGILLIGLALLSIVPKNGVNPYDRTRVIGKVP